MFSPEHQAVERTTMYRNVLILALSITVVNVFVARAADTSQVTFNDEGIAIVNGKPFFPIGVFTYGLSPEVLAELREVKCNTVVNGFQPDQLDLIHQQGLMAICPPNDAWIAAAKDHSALLAWYLTDEPENRGVTPAGELARYQALKKQDPRHPIGLCHTSFEALSQFKDACDFTMTDIYPITAARDRNIMGVSIMMDEARRIHGKGWPQWTCIQTFGGPEADGGIWAVPLPHEVRFMTYLALVHRATGILYFSYWPQAPRTWQSIALLNDEIHRLVPWLVAPGREGIATSVDERVEVRVRHIRQEGAKMFEPRNGFIIAINTSPVFVRTTIRSDAGVLELRMPFEGGERITAANGEFPVDFTPYGVHVYLWGNSPTQPR